MHQVQETETKETSVPPLLRQRRFGFSVSDMDILQLSMRSASGTVHKREYRYLMAFWLLFFGPGICSILLEVVTVYIVCMFSLLTI